MVLLGVGYVVQSGITWCRVRSAVWYYVLGVGYVVQGGITWCRVRSAGWYYLV